MLSNAYTPTEPDGPPEWQGGSRGQLRVPNPMRRATPPLLGAPPQDLAIPQSRSQWTPPPVQLLMPADSAPQPQRQPDALEQATQRMQADSGDARRHVMMMPDPAR